MYGHTNVKGENIPQLDVHKARSAYTDRACLLRSHSQAISKILNDHNFELLHGHIYFIRNNVHSAFCATVSCSTEIHCRFNRFCRFTTDSLQLCSIIIQKKAIYFFDVHVTVHRDKFLIINPTRCTNFSNLF
jgi:hypothetical protein